MASKTYLIIKLYPGMETESTTTDVQIEQLKLIFLTTALLSNKSSNNFIVNTKKYHVFAPMGRFQLELIYLYFPPSSQLVYLCFCPVGLSLL